MTDDDGRKHPVAVKTLKVSCDCFGSNRRLTVKERQV
jgi:hypothetical protein